MSPRISYLAGLLALILVMPIFPRAVNADATVQVQQMDPNADVSAMKQQGVEVHTLRDLQSPASKSSGTILSVQEREKLLARSGLKSQTQDMDDADKDVLLLRAKHYSVARLEKIYPHLDHRSLAKLHRLVRAEVRQ